MRGLYRQNSAEVRPAALSLSPWVPSSLAPPCRILSFLCSCVCKPDDNAQVYYSMHNPPNIHLSGLSRTQDLSTAVQLCPAHEYPAGGQPKSSLHSPVDQPRGRHLLPIQTKASYILATVLPRNVKLFMNTKKNIKLPKQANDQSNTWGGKKWNALKSRLTEPKFSDFIHWSYLLRKIGV